MALEFRPPTDLINGYLDSRERQANQLNSSFNSVLLTYAHVQRQKQQDEIKKQELDLKRQEEARNQGIYAREYNPAELPGAGGAYNQFSPQDMGQVSSEAPTLTGDAQMRSLLTQGGGPATMGSGTAQSPGPTSLMERFDQWKGSQGVGMGQNTALAPAPQNVQEQGNLDFANKFPQGLKAAGVDARMFRSNRPLDDKRTYQEKQEVTDDVTGEPLGYMTLDTRTGRKEFRSYADEAGNGGGQIPPGASFGPKVKPAIPKDAVEKNVAAKGFIDLLDRIEKNYKPEYVGPVQGRTTALSQKYDAKAIGFGATEGASNFVRDLADLRSAIVNERTGAAVGERQEWDRLLELIPDDKKSDIDFLPKIKSIKNRYNEIIQNRESGYKKAKYRSQGSSVQSTQFNDNEEADYQAWKATQP